MVTPDKKNTDSFEIGKTDNCLQFMIKKNLIFLFLIAITTCLPLIAYGNSNSLGIRYFSYNSDFFTSKNNAIGVFYYKRYFSMLAFRIESGGSINNYEYNYSYQVPYDEKSEERYYSLMFTNALLDFHFLGTENLFSPHLGGLLGIMELREHSIDTDYFDDDERSFLIYPIGLTLGVDLNIASNFSVNFEARYLFNSNVYDRKTIDYISFGEASKEKEPTDISGSWIGLGISLRF